MAHLPIAMFVVLEFMKNAIAKIKLLLVYSKN